jgi:pimeloyl-ACP methyl ester carboxylesterase
MVGLSSALADWQRGGIIHDYCGQHIFVKIAGTGPALLLIHGYPTSSYDWHAVWEPLSAHFTLIAPDMLGLGFSDKPVNHTYSIQDHADMHESLIKAMGLRAVHVMAHDLGVSVAQELLARREQDPALAAIASLTLLNGGVCPEAYRPRPIQRLLASPLGSWIGPHVSKAAFERAIASLFGPGMPPSPDLLNDFWSLVNHHDGRKVTHAVGRFWRERLGLRDRLLAPLLRSTVPIRFINGASDPNSGRHMMDSYRALSPDEDIVNLEGIGHWPQIEAPTAVALSFMAFVSAHTAPQHPTEVGYQLREIAPTLALAPY